MISPTNIEGLRNLRVQFEESTPAQEWPQAAASQLLLLSDVCAVLGMDEENTRHVLGSHAYTYLGLLVNGEAVP